jgi:hypothetical protein
MKVFAIIGAIVVILLLIAIPILLLIFVPADGMAHAANLARVVTSFFACGLLIVTTALVAVIAVLVAVITRLLDTKVSPLIDTKIAPLVDKINETADTARGTVAYVGEGAVSPLIKMAAILAGVRSAIRALFRGR